MNVPLCIGRFVELTKENGAPKDGGVCITCSRTFALDAKLTAKRGDAEPWGDPKTGVAFAIKALGKATAGEYFHGRANQFSRIKKSFVGEFYRKCEAEFDSVSS